MDAYVPVSDTVRPCIGSPALDQPWFQFAGTQTVLRYSAPGPEPRRGVSSVGSEIQTFIILDHPAQDGLQRLRTFKGWQDNWDAEGGLAPDPAVIDSATTVFGLLSLHRVPDVALSAQGHPMFVYGAPISGEVVVTGVDELDYFFADDNAPEGEGVRLSREGLPAELVDYLVSHS